MVSGGYLSWFSYHWTVISEDEATWKVGRRIFESACLSFFIGFPYLRRAVRVGVLKSIRVEESMWLDLVRQCSVVVRASSSCQLRPVLTVWTSFPSLTSAFQLVLPKCASYFWIMLHVILCPPQRTGTVVNYQVLIDTYFCDQLSNCYNACFCG